MALSASSRTQTAFAQRYGPWAVVTGATSGIGLAFAEALASLTFNVVLVARREAQLRDVAAKIRQNTGAQTVTLALDLARSESHSALLEETKAFDAGLLVAAAGFGTAGSFLDIDGDAELEMIAVNCETVVRQCRDFGLRFARRGRGGIVLMSSLLGFQGVPRSSTYAATKAFVETLAEGLHEELKINCVDVVASAPGPVRSGFGDRANMKMNVGVIPATVARETIAALGKRRVVVPGAFSKLLTYSLSPFGRRLRTAILGRIMANMTSHI